MQENIRPTAAGMGGAQYVAGDDRWASSDRLIAEIMEISRNFRSPINCVEISCSDILLYRRNSGKNGSRRDDQSIVAMARRRLSGLLRGEKGEDTGTSVAEMAKTFINKYLRETKESASPSADARDMLIGVLMLPNVYSRETVDTEVWELGVHGRKNLLHLMAIMKKLEMSHKIRVRVKYLTEEEFKLAAVLARHQPL